MILDPVATAGAETVCVIDRSAPLTVTEVEVVLFPGVGSVSVSLTVAVFVMVEPPGAAGFTATTSVKLPVVVPEFIAAFAVQVIVPVPPTAGTVAQVQPAAAAAETKVVFAGVLWVRVAPYDVVGPLLVTVSV